MEDRLEDWSLRAEHMDDKRAFAKYGTEKLSSLTEEKCSSKCLLMLDPNDRSGQPQDSSVSNVAKIVISTRKE